MCWSEAASLGMVGLGTVATGVTVMRREPPAIPFALGYFTLMEALQFAGYQVVDECGTAANQAITLLSFLHIVFQPFVINAFMMELVPAPVKARMRRAVFAVCAASAAVMLAQLAPFDWAGACAPGALLCAERLCLVSGEWHIAWDIPYNGLLVPLETALGTSPGFPSYMLAVFVMPLLYGAWRFVLFHLLAGPLLARLLTDNPNEMPAIWCLFSIGLVLAGLSPAIRRRFSATRWPLWPPAWRV
ncbi:DUF5765 domain-containing protein [Limibaculum sp. FT325]|uniref:DUF5765 domain-containing protein n=1 Tax=Thermohalobaculum sediminis TaxID=2939436 RepID=UPI0020BE3D0E|nr:DUF5765 domain-containing protein [Limibaculum sediminis]MCL5775936.1 DUF5765 domain-containing protein [Limibaculum sediminis]